MCKSLNNKNRQQGQQEGKTAGSREVVEFKVFEMRHGNNCIGKYRFLQTIGEGSFAKVKLAVDSSNDQFVAVKIIDKHMVEEANLKSQVRCDSSCSRFWIRIFFCFLGECFPVFLVSKKRGSGMENGTCKNRKIYPIVRTGKCLCSRIETLCNCISGAKGD